MANILKRIDDWLELAKQRRTYQGLGWIADAVDEYRKTIALARPEEIHRQSILLQKHLVSHPTRDNRYLVEAIALASVASNRLFGYFPNATQLIAAILLTEGRVVELGSGEGKTLVAFLAAYWASLTGHHVDIATTNDYLAERDQRWMGLAFTTLGLTVGLVTSTTPREVRKREYAKHVTYVANQELGFDYLRDNLAMDPHDEVSGPHDFVIVDEVDSILIDEARTALIITERDLKADPHDELDVATLQKLFAAIRELEPNIDYAIDFRRRSVALTESGARRVSSLLGPSWDITNNIASMRTLWHALYISVFLKPDEDYLVQENRVVLLNEFTGHAMPDRVLYSGLQRAVEVRAGVPPSGEFVIIAAITYRNFFQRYRAIAGMTGTAFDAASEFDDLYGLKIALLPPYRGSLRRDLATLFFRTREEKMNHVIREVRRAIRDQSPLLIIGRTVREAKQVSGELAKAGIPHQLLHAAVGSSEASIIEHAGKPGVITIATNMAGRGADIVIDESVRGRTGLRVIGLEPNLARRVDYQLRGRSGRQGQFGETQILASLEDELFQVYAENDFWDYAESLDWPERGITDRRLDAMMVETQKTAQDTEAELRLSLARFDSIIDHHRHAIYELRRLLLTSRQYLKDAVSELHRILFREPDTRMPAQDVESLLRSFAHTPEETSRLEQFFRGTVHNTLTGNAGGMYNDDRKAVIALLDEYWKQYLENVDWLEGWISFTAVGHEDPYVEFAETADGMFHDMRRSFAVQATKIIFRLNPS